MKMTTLSTPVHAIVSSNWLEDQAVPDLKYATNVLHPN